MSDRFDNSTRSRIMAAVKCVNTKPEITVRKLIHRLGYRYRLHRKDLPGKPDVVFGPKRKAIFIHGCFWHNHDCSKGKLPKSNIEFWEPKLKGNRERDEKNIIELNNMGWKILEIWQCEISDIEKLADRIIDFLEMEE